MSLGSGSGVTIRLAFVLRLFFPLPRRVHETRTFILLLCPTAVLSSSVSNIGLSLSLNRRCCVGLSPPPPHIADSGASFFIGLLYIKFIYLIIYLIFFRVLLVLVMFCFVLLGFSPSSVS